MTADSRLKAPSKRRDSKRAFQKRERGCQRARGSLLD